MHIHRVREFIICISNVCDITCARPGGGNRPIIEKRNHYITRSTQCPSCSGSHSQRLLHCRIQKMWSKALWPHHDERLRDELKCFLTFLRLCNFRTSSNISSIEFIERSNMYSIIMTAALVSLSSGQGANVNQMNGPFALHADTKMNWKDANSFCHDKVWNSHLNHRRRDPLTRKCVLGWPCTCISYHVHTTELIAVENHIYADVEVQNQSPSSSFAPWIISPTSTLSIHIHNSVRHRLGDHSKFRWRPNSSQDGTSGKLWHGTGGHSEYVGWPLQSQ